MAGAGFKAVTIRISVQESIPHSTHIFYDVMQDRSTAGMSISSATIQKA